VRLDREPCPHCGELIAPEARECPYCSHAVLVDLRLGGPVQDPRTRYQLARAFAALGPPFPGLVELQAALGSAQPVLGQHLTVAAARRGLEVLEAHALRGYAQPAPAAGSHWPKIAAAVAAAGVLGGLGWLGFRGQTQATPSEKAAAPSRSGPAVSLVSKATALAPRAVAARALPSTVAVRCGGSTIGAGFFIDKDLVLTNAHVACETSDSIGVLLSDGKRFGANVIQSDTDLDLALLRIVGASATPLPLGDVSTVREDQQVVVIGSPLGREFTVLGGKVTKPSQLILGVSYIEIDSAVQPGNSGGPLIDLEGRVLGVVSLKHAKAEGVGMAVPINYAYAGPRPFVAAPQGSDPAAFARMLEDAEADGRKLLADVNISNIPAMVVGTNRQHADNVAVGLALLSPGYPGMRSYTFKISAANRTSCQNPVTVTEWKAVEDEKLSAAFEGPLGAWIKRHGQDAQLYVGEGLLDLGCGRGSSGSLELLDGMPRASRAFF